MKEMGMKMMKSVVLLAVVQGLWMSQPVMADTQLNIQGTIKASPCTVDGDVAGSGINVSLGDSLQASTFANANSHSDWSTFTLKLKDCPATTTSATAKFSGTQATEAVTLYKNTGDASNVQIELQAQDGTNLGNNQTLTQSVNHTDNTVLFPLQARAYSYAGGATAGRIIGTVLVAFTYQ